MKTSLVLTFIFLSFNNAYAGSLLDAVKKDDFLILGNISVLKYAGDRYLVSVGVADISSPRPNLQKNARITSKVKAQHQLSQFINSTKIATKEILEEKIEIEKDSRKDTTRKLKIDYIEIIKEINEGSLKNIIYIGSWSNTFNYFYAIGIKVPK